MLVGSACTAAGWQHLVRTLCQFQACGMPITAAPVGEDVFWGLPREGGPPPSPRYVYQQRTQDVTRRHIRHTLVAAPTGNNGRALCRLIMLRPRSLQGTS